MAELPKGWVEWTVDSWVVALWFTVRDGRPYVAEMRVFPDSPDRWKEGAWPRTKAAVTSAPPGGITESFLQSLALQDLITEVTGVEDLGAIFKDRLRRWNPERPRGRSGLPDGFYVDVAYTWVFVGMLTPKPPSPLGLVAQFALGDETRSRTVETWLRTARRRGFLTTPTADEPTGHLTDEATALIETEEYLHGEH